MNSDFVALSAPTERQAPMERLVPLAPKALKVILASSVALVPTERQAQEALLVPRVSKVS